MKKRSYIFKTITFLIAIVISVTGVRTEVNAVDVSTIDYICQRSLCSQKMTCIGPILLGETIPSSDPLNGGKTYSELWTKVRPSMEPTEGHLYIVFCPKTASGNAGALLGHSYTYFFYRHNFAVTYKKLSKDVTVSGKTYAATTYHIKVSDCNSFTDKYWMIMQEEAGQNAVFDDDMLFSIIPDLFPNGCGMHKEEYASHGYTNSDWKKSSATQHTRTKTCTACGYSRQETSSHTWSNGTTTSLNDTQHSYTRTCSGCGYSEQVKSNHTLTNTYSYVDDNQHKIQSKCSGCNYNSASTENHNWTYTDYVKIDNDTHSYTRTCSGCRTIEKYTGKHTLKRTPETGYTMNDTETHMFTDSCKLCDYSSDTFNPHVLVKTYSAETAEQHSIHSECECGYALDVSYGNHHDDDGDCYCDDCGYLMTIFSVTVPSTMYLVMDKNGNVYSATNAAITNNSSGQVKVSSVQVSGQNGWNVVDYKTNMAKEKVDSKKIGFMMKDSSTNDDGYFTLNSDWAIDKNESLALPYSASVSATSSSVNNQEVLKVVFVIDWSGN